MALLLVLLPTILAFVLTRNEQCVPSPTIPTTTTPRTTTPPTTTPPTTTPPTTTTATTTPPTATTATSTTTPKSCPHSGYQLYPGYNCYKAFPSGGDWKTWIEARKQCIRDGGDLMVINSEREREDVYLPLYKSVSFYNNPWVGVYKADNDWTTVKGQPALSTWWKPGEPDGIAARKCAAADPSGLLWNRDCTYPRLFICEISL